MAITLNTNELLLLKFKFVLTTLIESRVLNVLGTKFETAVEAAREEAKKLNATVAYGGVEPL